jgi:hypothetical protein
MVKAPHRTTKIHVILSKCDNVIENISNTDVTIGRLFGFAILHKCEK